MTDVPGVDAARVTDWLAAHTDGVAPPLRFELIAGGKSNLTYHVIDAAGQRWVLRRPPLGKVLPTAHDMSREHRIIAALAGTTVPVPATVGLCTDEAVTGAPFYVMAYVDGFVLRDQATAEACLDAAGRRAAGRVLPEVLAALHSVAPDAVGLGQLGRREGYISRQLDRWYGQWERSKDRELPAIDRVYEKLTAHIPEQQGVGIVHGDFRLDNCILGPDGAVRAVLDWELCTLGDVLADVGITTVYWSEPSDPVVTIVGRPTLAEGFPSRAQMLETYATASGRDLAGIDYYVAFGYWKLACILQGVYARFVAGVMGQAGDLAAEMPTQIAQLAEAAEAAIESPSVS
jgi:aminoglycoside phosphotransferase (APT) family kinase protein